MSSLFIERTQKQLKQVYDAPPEHEGHAGWLRLQERGEALLAVHVLLSFLSGAYQAT